jgi:predicted kinase
VLVVVIGGPIASGKSALGREVAARLDAAVVDLDLVYEMLDPHGGPKDDDAVWTRARRAAARIAADGPVVVEGNVATDEALRELEAELPAGATVRLVLLDVDFETAHARALADPTRGVSQDRAFLSSHYGEFTSEWSDREVLRLHTGRATLAECAEAVVDYSGATRGRR